MPNNSFYPIGYLGTPWTDTEKKKWFTKNTKSRSYQKNIVDNLTSLSDRFTIIQYGSLSIDPDAYPLYAIKTPHWDNQKPSILITGGVHGYETSGVHGAIQFMEEYAQQYRHDVNIITLPCISPWGYEHIARWNPYAIDPNRSFVSNSPSEEATQAMEIIAQLTSNNNIIMHIDLHETTDSDESEFRPALAARDGKPYIAGEIPDGFYLVADSENPQLAFQQSIIHAVSQVTHIAPADVNGEIIGSKAVSEGIICYPLRALGLCAGMSNALFTTTTEVYPNSAKVTADDCNHAQVTAIKAALNYVIDDLNKNNTQINCNKI